MQHSIRQWIQLSEAFAHAFNVGTNTVTIFRNPSPKEYREALSDQDFVRALLVGDDILVWHVFGAMHSVVRREMQLPNTVIPIVIFGVLRQPCVVEVTDNSQNGPWGHNPEVCEAIKRHPYMQRWFPKIEVSYYDEAIVGDWRKLTEATLMSEELLRHTEDDDTDLRQSMLRAFNTPRTSPRKDRLHIIQRIGDIAVGADQWPLGARTHIFFLDNDTPIGMAIVQRGGRGSDGSGDRYGVTLIWLEMPYRHQGVGIAFYRFLMKHVALMPDSMQTTGGADIWDRLRTEERIRPDHRSCPAG